MKFGKQYTNNRMKKFAKSENIFLKSEILTLKNTALGRELHGWTGPAEGQ